MNKIKQFLPYNIYLLLAYMPFHIFLSQSLSLITGGLSVWKLAKDLVIFILLGIVAVSVYVDKKATPLFNRLVILGSVYGLMHLLIWLFTPEIYTNTAILGSIYNNRPFWLLIIGFGTVLLLSDKIKKTHKLINENNLIKLVITVSSIVALLGVIQYFLPKDILTHFGYSIERGVKPNFFIDDKPDLPRIMSTLRDPNSLGAYLILPIILLVFKWFKDKRNKLIIGGLIGLHGLALILTFSRAGWIGAVIAVSAAIAWSAKSWLIKNFKPVLLVGISVVMILFSLGYVFRDQYVVQNIIFHSDETTVAAEDSNELHLRFIKDGLRDISKYPFGHGPGTAGIVSIQNPDGGKLTENYYIQIGYEVGIFALILFIYTLFLSIKHLRKIRGTLAPALVCSLFAYLVLGFVMHLWSNEAITTQWWLLAGLALGLIANKKQQTIK